MAQKQIGESRADRIVDFIQRWWWVLSGLSLPGLSAWAKEHPRIAELTWTDAIVIGIFGSLAITVLILGALVLLRALYPKKLPIRDRKDFMDETINLSDLIAHAPAVAGKNFVRCVIQGPGQVKIQSNVTYCFCAMQKQNIVKAAVGQNIRGAVIVLQCSFVECYFDVVIIGTPEDADLLQSGVEILSLAEWKERYAGIDRT